MVSVKNVARAAAVLASAMALLSTVRVFADILYVSNSEGNTIERFTPDGAHSTFASTAGPRGLAFDSEGNLYVANHGANTITRFTTDGVGSVFATTGMNGPWGLAFDSSDNLYVGNTLGQDIVKFTPDGVGTVFASSSNLGEISALAFDQAGNLYAASYVAGAPGHAVEKFSPLGVDLGGFASPTMWPTAMAFDNGGNLYVASTRGIGHEADYIEMFTPSGIRSVFATAGMNAPWGLAFDSEGNLYVANIGSNTIERFTPDGAHSTFASTGLNIPVGIAMQVPEPATLSLLALGALALMRRRRAPTSAGSAGTPPTACPGPCRSTP